MKILVAMPIIAGTIAAFALIAPRKTQSILGNEEPPRQEPTPERSLKSIRAVRVRSTLTVVPSATPAVEPKPVPAVERLEEVEPSGFQPLAPEPHAIDVDVPLTPEPPKSLGETVPLSTASAAPTALVAPEQPASRTLDRSDAPAAKRARLSDLIGSLVFGGRGKRQSMPRPADVEPDAVDLLLDDADTVVGDVITVADAVRQSVETSTARRVRPAVAPPAIVAAESAMIGGESVVEEQDLIVAEPLQVSAVEVVDKADEPSTAQAQPFVAELASEPTTDLPTVAVELQEPTARTIQRVASVISMFAFRRKRKTMNAGDVLSADSARRIIQGVVAEEEAQLPPDDIPHLSPERIAAADERLQEIAETPVFEAPAVAVALVPGWANEYAALEMDVTVEGRERLVARFGLLDHEDLVESLNRVFLSEDAVRVRVLGLTLIGERNLAELVEVAKHAGTSSDPYERCAAVIALGGCKYGEFVVIFLEDEDTAVVRTAVAQIVDLFEAEFARAKVEESNGPHKQLAIDTLELLLGE